jgi:hypothetical protein
MNQERQIPLQRKQMPHFHANNGYTRLASVDTVRHDSSNDPIAQIVDG